MNIRLLSSVIVCLSLCTTSCTQQEENEVFAEETEAQVKVTAQGECTITPGKTLERIENPRDFGFDPEKLEKVKDYARRIGTDALLVGKCGRILVEFGRPGTKYAINSMRKPLMGAVYGKYVENGTIDLTKTLGQLEINDVDGLSELELSATLEDVIGLRSGVYHNTIFETPKMIATKPPRNSQKPGDLFYYGNWDHGAYGTVFSNETGLDFFRALKEDILDPIGVKGFRTNDGSYIRRPRITVHPVYSLKMNAFTLFRFGVLMSREGDWGGTQIVPKDWINDITSYHSNAAIYERGGAGKFAWWNGKAGNEFPHFPHVTLSSKAYHAFGFGGQYLVVDPVRDLIVVHQVRSNREVTHEEMGMLLKLISDAKI
ncbi:serine hydrolase [Aquimarina sp. AU58]|uniref:serine hydrolase domain-containing protein n=1 Tax=Aquimarina sp. AU58 TaxID=1874112 RepID=UPI0013580176|nr:serine hydrolase domain-containing protein [Aquimarina sp. AU58]